MKLYWPVIGLLLIGCQKKEAPAVAATAMPTPTLSAPTTQSVYAIGGQSNSLYMGQRQREYIRQQLGAVAVVNCGVERTRMALWTRGGGYYDACITDIRAVLAANPGSTLKGVLFWQGESDCNAEDIDQWPGRFRAFVEGMRAEFSPSLPIVFAQITDTHTNYRDQMRAYQSGMYIPGVEMVKTDGIAQDGDHTDAAGYATMAERFIQALK